MNKKIEGNVAMAVSKTFSGLNMNALKYLIPVWIAPVTGVTIRVSFAAVAFWIIACFIKEKDNTTTLQKCKMFLLGFLGITGYMVPYLVGLKYTTPVSSSILLALVPLWVFILAVAFFNEKLTILKASGLIVGIGGACLCMLSKKDASIASNPILGNTLTLVSSFAYALYLVFSNKLLKNIGMYTVLKWSFLGSACSAGIINTITRWNAPLFDTPLHWLPIGVLLFVLVFPTVLSYLLLPLGLENLKTTVVSMYGYWVVAVATIVGLIIGQDKFDIILLISIICLFVGLFMVEEGELLDKKRKKIVADKIK